MTASEDEEPPEPPERIADEAVRLGHEIDWDDPAPVRAVKRWTCEICGESAWCDARDEDVQWGPVLTAYCRGYRLPPKPPSWMSSRKIYGPPP